MTTYFEEQRAGIRPTQARFAGNHGVSLRALRYQLSKHGESAKRGVLQAAAPRRPSPVRVMLTDRDETLLARLGHDRCLSLGLVADWYFAGAVERYEAASKRLALLEKAGYLRVGQGRPPLVTLTRKGARRLGRTTPRAVHPRHLAHHLATLRAIETFREHVEARGGRLVPTQLVTGGLAEYQLEFHIQAAERRGHGTLPGGRYDVSPDAIVFAELPDPTTGELRPVTVALEY